MRIFRFSVGIAFLALCGCVSLSPETQQFLCSAIDYSLSGTPAVIKNKADSSNHQAQLAYAVVVRFGLNQTPVDVGAADAIEHVPCSPYV